MSIAFRTASPAATPPAIGDMKVAPTPTATATMFSFVKMSLFERLCLLTRDTEKIGTR